MQLLVTVLQLDLSFDDQNLMVYIGHEVSLIVSQSVDIGLDIMLKHQPKESCIEN